MVRKASKDDLKIVADLAVLMWGDNSVDELADEFSKLLSKDDAQIFLRYEDGIPVGFAQCQLRCDYVEGLTHEKKLSFLYTNKVFIYKNIREGAVKKAAKNLQAIVKSTMKSAFNFTKP